MDKSNNVLKSVMQKIYNDRKPLKKDILSQVRNERVNDGNFCEVWFMTQGCTHDSEGGCTMCNYGKGYKIDDDLIVSELASQIKNLPENLQELIITPSGSMLDDNEVPEALRKRIFSLIHHINCEDFFIETRVDSITREKLEVLKDSVHAKRINIEIGVECCDDWILRNCVNKNITLNDMEKSISIIHEAGMYVYANIGIGIPFLTERCSMEYAKYSIRKAFEMGCDKVVLFPYHIKPGTLLEWLLKHDLYHCCSLWTIPEILSAFNDEELQKIHISWYRNYYSDKKKIIESPAVESEKMDEVLMLLDEYKNHPCMSSLLPLLNLRSEGRTRWKNALSEQTDRVDFEKIHSIYSILKNDFDISEEAVDIEWSIMNNSYQKEEWN